MNIGIIGCGELGSRMAKRLVDSGYNVFGYDICQRALEKATDLGIQPLQSPKEVADNCEIIITCVTDQHAVEQCITGESGIVEAIKKNSIIIETTTSVPSVTQKMGTVIRGMGADLIDAPVSRGIPAADNGTLSILVGGRSETLKRSMPVLEILGTDIIHCGDLGAGHTVKAINMMMMACNLLATTEVVTLGKRAGMQLEEILAVINSSTGSSFMTTNHFPKYVQIPSYRSNFSFELMYKDLNIAMEIADDLGLSLVMGRRCVDIYKLLSNKISDGDNMELVREIQKWMGDEYANKIEVAN